MLTAERKKEYYQALLDRNTKYEGIFYVGVKTTGLFCRPTCPTKKPTIERCEFFETAQQARLASYQPCQRCRPDLDIPGRLPRGGRHGSGPSDLKDDTELMAREQRKLEQKGHRRLAKVHAREHSLEEQQQPAPEGELQNNILQHPELDNQRFDGIDPTLNPAPELNSDARLDYDNERREQEKEKQLRLENALGLSHQPKFSPKPGGP